MQSQDAFYIGYLTKTRGLKGELQLFFEFEQYENLDLGILWIEQQNNLIPFFTSQVKILNNSTAFIFLEDVNHINQAQNLIKSKVYLKNDKMPIRDKDAFFYSDLKNYLVEDTNLGSLGYIIEIQEMPQQIIATVKHQGREIMFPLNEDFIVKIDEEKEQISVQLPHGLIDIYLNT